MTRPGSPRDPTLEALHGQGTAHPRPEDVSDPLFLENSFFDPRDLVQVKYEMLRRVRREGMAVTDAAAAFGLSRVAFYQTRKRFEESGLTGLLPRQRGPRRSHKLSEEVMAFVERGLAEDPALRAPSLAEMVGERFGVSVHPRSIERALVRRQKKQLVRPPARQGRMVPPPGR